MVDLGIGDLSASIGIVKGKPFAPDARMKEILTDSAAVGNATARWIVFNSRLRDICYYESSSWATAFVGGRYLNARTLLPWRRSATSGAVLAHRRLIYFKI